MLIFDGPVTPDALTTFVRRVPTPANFTLNTILPDQYFTTNTIDFAELQQRNRTARFRAYDGNIHVATRDAPTVSAVDLPPLSDSLGKGEYERLQLEFARTRGTNMDALIQAIYNDAQNLTGYVINRMEQARGDVLTDGKFTLVNEGGLTIEADFGVPANHIVNAAASWATTSTDILGDLVAYVDTYTATNGAPPGAIRTSLKVQRYMQKNLGLIAAVHGSTTGRTRINLADLNGLFDSEGIPQLAAPYDAVVDVDGTTTRIIPDDRVLLTPLNPSDLGYTAWGVSATALELVNSNHAELSFGGAPGIVGVVIKEGPPFREFTFVDAVGMPVLANPKALFVADVA